MKLWIDQTLPGKIGACRKNHVSKCRCLSTDPSKTTFQSVVGCLLILCVTSKHPAIIDEVSCAHMLQPLCCVK